MHAARRLFVVGLLAGAARALEGQASPGRNLVVNIDVAAATMRGDTTRLTYLLTNHKTSAEELFQFTVDAPTPATLIVLPEPDSAWNTGKQMVGRSVARWAMLAGQMRPGSTSPPLSFEAVGLAGLVDVWVRGHVAPEVINDAEGDGELDASPVPDWFASAKRTTTVGISPLPAEATNTVLLARLDSLTVRSCTDLTWITSRARCTGFDEKLSTVSLALAGANNKHARIALMTYIGDLDATRFPRSGPPMMSGSAYWLLRTNATYLLQLIPVR